MIDTAKIAKNTVYLYIRMILVLGANFYAVRILLDALGVEDYGLFNLIVGFVTLFTLLNGAMQSTVQRFLCYEMGKDSGGDTKTIFSTCLILFAALALGIFIASETIGLWFVNHKLNIPADRTHSAVIVYQLSILVMLFKTLQIPYTALIVSYEQMNAFAKISIVEAVLTLGAALALQFIGGDRLIWYAALFAGATGAVMISYFAYCRFHFGEARIWPQFKKGPLKELGSFFSWSIFAAVANMLKQQGLNVLINIFFGVAFNATWAVANKVGMAVNQLVVNFQQAFNPQIVKSWAAEDKKPFFMLLIRSSFISFCLIWICALPLLVFPEFILGLWLKGELPPQLVIFLQLSVLFFVFDALSGPLWMAVQATGRIALYQVQVSCLMVSSFFLGWIAFTFGAPAWAIMAINACINCVCLLYRIVFLKKRIGFPAIQYILFVLLPSIAIAAISYYVATFVWSAVK